MALLTADADAFAQCFASKTKLNVNVVRAWVILESAGGRSPAGPYNFLNIRAGSGWARYASPEDACNAAYHLFLTAPASYGYGAIVVSAGLGTPADQIAAITASKWCYSATGAGNRCYGGWGGPNLVAIYNQLTGQHITPNTKSGGPSDPTKNAPSAGVLGSLGGNIGADAAVHASSILDTILKYGLRAVYVILGIVAAGIGVVFIAKETEAGKQIIQKVPVAAKVASYA